MIVSSVDVRKLRALLQSRPCNVSGDVAMELDAKIDRASVVDASMLPPDVVKIDSAVMTRDVASGMHHYLLLLLLHPDSKRSGVDVSVLDPLGLALLGRRIGDVVEWRRPDGRRHMRIEAVQQPLAIRTELSPNAI